MKWKRWTACLMAVTMFCGVTEPFTIALKATAEDIVSATTADKEKDLQAQTEKLISLTNEKRISAGLAPLQTLDTLQECAVIRAKELTEKFDHVRPDGSSYSTVLNGIEFLQTSYENIWAEKEGTAESSVSVLENDPTREGHILNPEYNYTAVAIFLDEDGYYYWVQLFAKIEETQPTTPLTESELKEQQEKLISLTNEKRISAGLAPLQTLDTLQECAVIRAKELTESLSHTRPDGSNYGTVLKNIDSLKTAYEDVWFEGTGTAENSVSLLADSSTREENVLNSKYNYTAVSIFSDGKGGYYWVQLFAEIDENQTTETQPDENQPQTPLTESELKEQQEKLVSLTNEKRISAGLAPLQTLDTLQECAVIRAKELTESLSHTRPDGSNYATVLKDIEFLQTAYEDVWFEGTGTAENSVSVLADSATREENVLNPDYNYTAVSIFSDGKGGYYWVQLFAKIDENQTTETQPDENQTKTPLTESELKEQQEKLVSLTNEKRISAGLAPLQTLDTLQECAVIRAEELTENLSHIRPDGSNYATVLKDIDSLKTAYEDIWFEGTGTAENAVSLLADSVTREKAVLNPDYNYTAVSVVSDGEGGYYWVQLFAGIDEQSSKNLIGDIDGNGEVSIIDVLLLNQYLLSLYKIPEERLPLADVNHDGKIADDDAITILKSLVGLAELS